MRMARVALGVALAGVLSLAEPAAAEDEWVVTLTNGKRFSGKLVSKRDDGVTLRIGESEINLSSNLVSRIDRVEKEPEPVAETEDEGDEDASGEDGGEGGELPEGSPAGPKPSAILLRDGTVVEGFVVSRAGGVLWIVPASELISVSEEDVSETFGDTSGTGGGGIAFSGDVLQDSRRMLDELGSGDSMRMTVAATVLDKYGAEAAPVLIEGLRHAQGSVRKQCISLLQAYKVKKAVDPVLGVLRNDFDPDVRAAAAKGMFEWNSPEVRRALMDAAWRDRADEVKIACLNTLARCATAEEATALMDLLAIFDATTPTGLSVMAALKQATGQAIADDPDLWRKWWYEGGGRLLIGARVEKIAQDRVAESERQYLKLMRGDEPAPPAPEEEPKKPTGPLTAPIPGLNEPPAPAPAPVPAPAPAETPK